MKKYFLPVFLILSFPAMSQSAELGISGAVGSQSGVRVPIKFEGFVIEPYLSYHTFERERTLNNERTENVGFGFGFWKTLYLQTSLTLQLGLQLGYSEREVATEYYDIGFSTSNLEGYELAPGFGVFYGVSDKLEVGLEVKYRYSELDGERFFAELDYSGYEDSQETAASLQTQAVVRIYL